jgi:SAM-dependent methyltransferase
LKRDLADGRALIRQAYDRLPPRVRHHVRAALVGAGSEDQWLRKSMNDQLDRFFAELPPSSMDVIEVSGDLRGDLPWKSYGSLTYPAFDICAPSVEPGGADLVICEQVLEHVRDPYLAARNLGRLARTNGHVLVSTPFLVRLHDHPEDHWRFSPSGMRLLLEAAGLEVVWVRSWGNRSCVRRNLRRWAPYRPWHSLRNEKDLPLVVWALARKPGA